MTALLAVLLMLTGMVINAQPTGLPFEPVFEISAPDGYGIPHVDWSPDNAYVALSLAIGTDYQSMQYHWAIYGAATGELLYESEFLRWYAGGSHILVSDDTSLMAFNVQTREIDFRLAHTPDEYVGQRPEPLDGEWGRPRSTVDQLVFLSDAGELSVYDAFTGESLFTLDRVLHPPSYLPGEKWVAVERIPDGIEIYDRTRWTLVDALPGYRNVREIDEQWWSADGQTLLVTKPDNTSNFWMIGKGLSTPLGAVIGSIRWSPDGRQMVGFSGEENTVMVFDIAASDAHYAPPTSQEQSAMIAGMDGWELLISVPQPVLEDSYYAVWNLKTREFTLRFRNPLGYSRVKMANSTIIVEDFTSNRRYQVYSVDDGLVVERGGLDAMPSFSPDHRWALNLVESAAGKPDTVVLDDLQTGAGTLIETGLAGRVWFRWSPDASAFAMYKAETDSVIVWRNKD
jgi:WD40 repeat protein